jgi:hypothetical protein
MSELDILSKAFDSVFKKYVTEIGKGLAGQLRNELIDEISKMKIALKAEIMAEIMAKLLANTEQEQEQEQSKKAKRPLDEEPVVDTESSVKFGKFDDHVENVDLCGFGRDAEKFGYAVGGAFGPAFHSPPTGFGSSEPINNRSVGWSSGGFGYSSTTFGK